MNYNEELITEIYSSMNFECKSNSDNNSGDGSLPVVKSERDGLNEILKTHRTSKSFVDAIEAASKALLQWKKFSALSKSNSLYLVWKALVDKSNVPSSLKNDLSILINCFDFYSDMAVQIGKLAEPVGVVLVILPPRPCFFMFGAIVPAALAAGCSVVVHCEQAVIPLLLEEVIKDAGFPDGIFNVVTEPLADYNSMSKNIQKTIYCGSFSAVQDFYSDKIFESFKFFSPNNTAALVLESCDLNSAVGQIFNKTWEYASFWAVSTVVVQESVIQKFLEALKFQMNMNSNKFIFENKEILQKMDSVILEAVKAGAVVVKASQKENEYGPTALVNYQNQEEDLPILKVLVCRTPKEGVKLLNNFHALGTSIWSEFSAQALEVASQLESLNIWINCHGVVETQAPVSLTGSSGNFVFGGRQGVLEYLSSGGRECLEPKSICSKVSRKSEVLEIIFSSKKAFELWHSNKNKSKSFKAFALSMGKTKEFFDHARILSRLACLANCPKFSETNSTEEFFIVYEEMPIGVIGLFVPSGIDTKNLLFLIGLPIALGNTVILVMEEENPFATCLVHFFNKNLMKNLLTVVCGNDAGLILASDPAVQALWMCNELVSKLKEETSKNLKRMWAIPKDVFACEELVLMQCIKRKIIWLPKAEKFP